MRTNLAVQLKDDRPVCCGDCDWAGAASDLPEIKDLPERITPGSEVPAGECPNCGSLAYVTEQSRLASVGIVHMQDGSRLERKDGGWMVVQGASMVRLLNEFEEQMVNAALLAGARAC